ncbi:T9SS type A sorting domain-containing protein [Olleya sp. Bg11-27]|uniref:T9SS type A sorting domain-containing protein n=1 Tax=Olleya sp. Bg11-27 TaxID=2058135 RepID=UPI000C30AEF0|nr:T9SS type A sorting domain-containing protein [Olleya sp. Bg11-27]AUC77648.1 hypothetical protein CW732_18970 [Olleya sp. Bg11-27]
MCKKLLIKTLNFRALFTVIAFAFSVQTFALEDTRCGSISGFEFSNGNSTTRITNNQSYYIGDLPSDFYVDLQVNGYSRSAKFYVKNLDTGQRYSINENRLPYTFPGGNGAWNLGCGNFEIKSKIYKYRGCGSYCDSETIRFTITCDDPCGDIAGYEFSNGSETVAITNNAVYELNSLPNNFYLDLLVNGQSESASLKVKNLTTGQTFTIRENYLPYTAPGGNAAWSYGTGNFKIISKIFATNYCQGDACDQEVVYFTINDTVCGEIEGFEFSNFSDTAVSIVDGASYDLNTLPSNFNINLLTSGPVESARFTLTNTETGEVFNRTENVVPYTYPGATNVVWAHGCGTFKICSNVYLENNANGEACDSTCITFTINCEAPCGDISGYEFSNGTDAVAITNNAVYELNSLPNDFYVDLLVNGESESASLKVKNLTTGQTFNVGENYLPYTAPGGNAAWSYGVGDFEITGKIFATNYCQGDACDEAVIYFTINDTVCGEIEGFEFSNFSDAAVSIVDGGSYDLNNLPTDFNINLITSGPLESAFFTLTNTETGEVFTKTENVVPFTYPGATNAVWPHGCGTFNICSNIYLENNTNGIECGNLCVTFTINCEVPCGAISEFAFSNGTDNITVADGGEYNVSDLPTDFYVSAITEGGSESVRLTATNLDTNASLVFVENVYPLEGAAWSLGLGNFQIQAELFSGDTSTGTLCDVQTVNFTLVDVLECEAVYAGTGVLSTGLVIVSPGVTVSVNVITNNDAILPLGYQLGTVLTKGNDLIIEKVSSSTTISMPEVGGFYKVHTIAYNPATFNLSDISLGNTTVFNILDLIANNEICADINEAGVPLTVIMTGSTDRVAVTAETKTSAILESDIKLYPNPVVDQLNVNITLLQGEVLTYAMMDVNGKQVLAGRLSNNTNRIQTNQLAGGLYILRMTSETRSFTKKVVVRK